MPTSKYGAFWPFRQDFAQNKFTTKTMACSQRQNFFAPQHNFCQKYGPRSALSGEDSVQASNREVLKTAEFWPGEFEEMRSRTTTCLLARCAVSLGNFTSAVAAPEPQKHEENQMPPTPLIDDAMAWKLLLTKYIANVAAAEGEHIALSTSIAPCGMFDMEFTDEDKRRLEAIFTAILAWNDSVVEAAQLPPASEKCS